GGASSMNVSGTLVSIVTVVVTGALWLPAGSVAVISTVWSPSGSGVDGSKLQLPFSSAVVVPAGTPSMMMVTVAPGSVVPLSVGVVSFVGAGVSTVTAGGS